MHIYLPRRPLTSLCHLAEGCNEDKVEDFQVQDVRKDPCKRRRSSAEPVQLVKVSHTILQLPGHSICLTLCLRRVLNVL